MLKLCGIRRQEDISYINEFPPDFMGMILSGGFKRSVDTDTARKLLTALDRKIKPVGVFVDESPEAAAGAANDLDLSAVQLHGNESGEYVKALRKLLPHSVMIWKAVKVRSPEDIAKADSTGCDFLLLDSFVQGQAGGTGKSFDWEIISSVKIKTPYFLAGGITPENLPAALAYSENVDISGGAEENGVKSREKIKKITEIYGKGGIK